jgi:N-methylhydantoinase A
MEAAALETLVRAGVPAERREITRSADLRYRRQAYELTVPVADGGITRATLARLAADFHDKHRMTYGHASPDEPVQLVNLRLGGGPQVALGRGARRRRAAPTRARCTTKPGRACEVLSRDALPRNEKLALIVGR